MKKNNTIDQVNCSKSIVSPMLKPLHLIYCLYADMQNDLENNILSHANESTLYAEVASPTNRINAANSLNQDFLKIQ